MYPVYELQVYDYIRKGWFAAIGQEASNRSHHYDTLRSVFNRWVAGAKGGSPNQKPIGYRITSDGQPVDTWTNGKVPQVRPHTAHDGRTCRLVRVRLTPDEYEWVKEHTTTDSRRELLLAKGLAELLARLKEIE